MARRVPKFVAALTAVCLSVAACGNSGDDSSGDSSNGEAARSATGVDDSQRDTFEEISGVPGVTDDAITFDVIGLKSNNPLGTCILDCYVEGIQAYFDYRNAEGGIYGRDLKIGQVLDDEMAQNQQRVLEVTSANDAFGVFQAPLVASGFADLDSAGIPTFSWGIHPEAAGKESIFPSVAPSCFTCTSRVVPYVAQLAGAHKVASLGYGVSENSKLCAQANRDSLEKYGDDIDAEVAYLNDNLDFGLPNGIAPEVTAMKDAGVDFITSCLDLNGMKTLAAELARQGMGDVPMFHPNTYNQQFVREANGLFEGDYVQVGFRPFEADRNEALDAFLNTMDENGSDLTELAMVGWINADEAFTSLLAAEPQFDRQKAIDGLNSLTDYSANGLLVPIDWTRQHNPPTEGDPSNDYVKECVALVKVVDSEFEVVAPPDTPWFCWSNENQDWSEPEPTTFGE